LPQHHPDLMLQAQEDGSDVAIKGAVVEIGVLLRHECPGLLKARIVEGDIQPAVVGTDSVVQRGDLLGRGHIALDEPSALAGFRDQPDRLLSFLPAASRHDRESASARKGDGRRPANPRAASRDQSNLFAKAAHNPASS
jgi:hypothetical protein